jgi:hypothetical protein
MSSSIRFAIRGRAPLLLALLASCATPSALEAVAADSDEIVFSYTADRAAEAERQASLYCANLGRAVRLRDETRGASDRIIATFECRPSR